jgi:hypothetical protein
MVMKQTLITFCLTLLVGAWTASVAGMDEGWGVFKRGATLYLGPPQGLIVVIR